MTTLFSCCFYSFFCILSQENLPGAPRQWPLYSLLNYYNSLLDETISQMLKKHNASHVCYTITALVTTADEGNHMVKVKTVRLPQTLPLWASSHSFAPSPRQPVTTPRQSLRIIINLNKRTDKSRGGFIEKYISVRWQGAEQRLLDTTPTHSIVLKKEWENGSTASSFLHK